MAKAYVKTTGCKYHTGSNVLSLYWLKFILPPSTKAFRKSRPMGLTSCIRTIKKVIKC